MKTKQPFVSVIMPVYNAGDFLVEAIESIRLQTHSNWELICIDDSSTDDSLTILENYQKLDKRIKVYRNKTNKGIGYSLNRALKLAKGSLIARMDADDISLPDRFAKQVGLLLKRPTVVACGGQAAMIDRKGIIFAYKRFPTESKKLYEMIMRMVPIQHPIIMAKASSLKKYRYNEYVTTAEDVDMLFYLLNKGALSNVDSVIYKYRKSDTSNGYHNVKKTFYITFMNRFRAIEKYSYAPTVKGVLITLGQFLLVSVLPNKLVVNLFEAFRYEPPLWKKPLITLTNNQIMTTTAGRKPI